MNAAIARIAFVTIEENAYTRQLASGLSRFAKPSHGFMLREFVLDGDAKELPPAFESWSPDAAVGYIAGDAVEMLAALTTGGRPLVNTSRAEPLPGRGVVLGDAEEVYNAVHDHFRQLGVTEVVQFVMGESLGAFGSRERYRRFAEDHGIPFRSFGIPDPAELGDLDQMRRADEAVARWLHGLPRPTGIFSQNSLAGNYLCRTCELLGIAVPGEIAVIGTDGFDVALAARPPVTSLQLPGDSVGYEAGKLVAAMLEGLPAPLEILRVSGARLIVRASTRKLGRKDCDIDAALAFIFSHACEGIHVNDVVSHTQGVSRMTFHKQFVDTVGMTPGAAIKGRRLSEARRLLSETALSSSTIAGMCGFDDYIHFYRVFRHAEGLGPRDYRRTVLQE